MVTLPRLLLLQSLHDCSDIICTYTAMVIYIYLSIYIAPSAERLWASLPNRASSTDCILNDVQRCDYWKIFALTNLSTNMRKKIMWRNEWRVCVLQTERSLFLLHGEAEWVVNPKIPFSFPFSAVSAFQNTLKVLKHFKKIFKRKWVQL